jgi:hypothetical protein
MEKINEGGIRLISSKYMIFDSSSSFHTTAAKTMGNTQPLGQRSSASQNSRPVPSSLS